MLKKSWPWLLMLAIGLWAAWPLCQPGFIPTHDGEYHLIRFYEFDKNIRAGIWWPRWAPGLNHGLGVPLFNFFYPLPNFVAEIFYLLGFSLITSFKLTMAFGLVTGGLFFYLWIKKIFNIPAAVVGAVFYTLAPYHLLNVYVRGSIGEVLAMALFPAILWAVEKKSWWLSIFLALLILAHNILALIFTPFLISYMFLFHRPPPRRASTHLGGGLVFSLFFGLGLSAIFWLPALAEAKYVTGLQMINFADHFPTLWQLILPSWGTGFSVPGIGDQMSFQIGLPHLLAVALGILLIKKKVIRYKFFLGWFLGLVCLLLPVSLPVWKIIKPLVFLQYPWRLLSLVVLVTSFLAACLVSRKGSRWAVGLLLVAFIFYGGYSRPIVYPPRADNFYLDNPDWTQGTATLGNSFQTLWPADPGNTPIRSLATGVSLASLIFIASKAILKRHA
ncbi:hypothetical protein COT66_00390 [Candidatus Shapirobacteria bacterium CG09_land_8_20_14_0_10_49_15]|uniref:Membrane protein 6-pyruvoyl-tetrahydropterin synthase-related domain-containing protein n=2 Tax=Candidatus Shapironibacteriota TaxID=1752721 RepID=A0A2M8L701_9BACT|nr:MAG: hypothetical protein COT66_00390 [Candidatus Shapirobacteria bacterium CG09_land_8_20_14_0_10_49_15]PJE70011.1 MAG: hypothetical protein COU97_01975 [Candidatus Shapirobacteria bacterium CG10_big_fil_rev_8_21_14_0_10_48_15]